VRDLLVTYALILLASVVCWNLLVRRWRLAGPAAPPRAALGVQEYAARRFLRALLAFDALLIVPACAIGALGSFRSGELGLGVPILLLVVALFFAPVPALLRKVRTLEALRLAGVPEAAAARLRTTGHAGLDLLLRGAAPTTRATAALIVITSAVAMFYPELSGWLCKSNPEVLAGQVWRLATVALVHGGFVHLFFNTSIFVDVGGLIERLCGAGRMLAIFWGGTVAGSLASVLLIPLPSVGASGGVFALLGALLAVSLRHRRELPPVVRARLVRSTAWVIGANVILGFLLPHVDWAAHLGGLAAGLLLGGGFGLGPVARAALADQRGR
jgi:membrane associated rhomboid family serine protease